MKKPNKKGVAKIIYASILFIIVMIAIYFAFWLNKIDNLPEQSKEKINTKEIEPAQVPEGLQIGDEVIYVPKDSTYTWKAEYCSATLIDDILLNNQVEFNLNKWKVFDIDYETGIVELISDNPTEGQVLIDGAQGYNNCVKLLNEACSKLYGNFEKGIEARSIKLEDIEEKMVETELSKVHNYLAGQNIKVSYNTQFSSQYNNQIYPIIYEQENMSVINNNKNSNGIGRSEQNDWYSRSEKYPNTGNIKVAESIKPYQTFCIQDIKYLKNAFKGDGEGENNIIYSMIIPKSDIYWVATRAVNIEDEYCEFVTYSVQPRGIAQGNIFFSNDGGTVSSNSLRPILSLRADILKKDEMGNWQL